MKFSFWFFGVVLSSAIHAQTPSWAWARTAGSAGNWDFSGMGEQYTSTIATDKFGNSYVTGHFTGTAVFGTITVSSPLFPAVFTAKYDSSGNCMWVKHFGALVPPPPAPMQMANNGKAIDIDSLGNCYVTGSFQGSATDTIYFGTSKLVGFDDTKQEIFVVKYDANGNEVWATQSKYLSGVGGETSNSISVDKAGNSFVNFNIGGGNACSFGNLPPVTAHGGYVVKFNSSGIPLWTQQMGIGAGPPNCVVGYAIDNDEAGNCYVTGVLSGTAVAGTSPPTTLTALGNKNQKWDTYVSKLNPNGTFAWIKQFGHPEGLSFGNGVGVDGPGNIYFVSNFDSIIAIGSNTLITLSSVSSRYNSVITKLDNSGNVIWSYHVPAAESIAGALKVSASGNSYYVSRNTQNNISSIQVGKLNTAGFSVWSQSAVAQTGQAASSGISVGAQEDVYIAGFIQGSSIFGNYVITSAGGYDVMIAKLTSGSTSTLNTALAETNNSPEIFLFPNPFESELYVRGTPAMGINYLVLYNLLGQEMTRLPIEAGKKLKVDRSKLSSGIYIYQIFSDNTLLSSGKIFAE